MRKKGKSKPNDSQGVDRDDASGVTRRGFLKGLGGVSAVGLASGTIAFAGLTPSASAGELAPTGNQRRRVNARNLRKQAAKIAFQRALPDHPSNGDEERFPFSNNYAKGLAHDSLGEVDPNSYMAFLKAASTETEDDFEAIPLVGERKLVNPHAGHAFDLEGPDSHHTMTRPPPTFDSAELAGEMGEMYWHALARDESFIRYDSSAPIADAADDLSTVFSDFRGPKDGGVVTPQTLFRIDLPGALLGPYVSQFMLKDVPYGTLTISQRQRTTMPRIDYVTDFDEYLYIEQGHLPSSSDVFDPVKRYIRNGRDLATYVHFDALYEAYLNACLILLGMGAPVNPGNPYNFKNKSQGFGTFGGPHILSLVCEVATRALKGIWYHKWQVHRRARPEVIGCRIDVHLIRHRSYPLNAEVFNSQGTANSFHRFHSYLLPMAYPEASPLHPSYGSGHTTVAGACVTILKWFFDESFVLPNPVVPNADGTGLDPYTGFDVLTVGGELNKVAMNVSMARNFAGIHWRTDSTESLKLGEEIAIGILEEQKLTYKEEHSITFTKFDGTPVTI